MFTCLLITCLSILLLWLWRVWIHIYTIFLRLHGFSIFILISYIILFSCIAWHAFTDVLSFNMLSLVTCLISPPIMLSPVMLLFYTCVVMITLSTYHLHPIMLIFDLWLSHLWEPIPVILIIYSELLSYIIYTMTWIYGTHVFLLYMYYYTPKFLIMSCSCYSCKLIIT